MTITPNFQVSNLLLSKEEEGYFTPIDLGQLNEIYEISQDILNVEDRDHREFLKEFDEIEIEYSINSFAVGY